MNLKLTQTLVVGLVALLGHGTAHAGGLVDDFRLELKWRSDYEYNDFEAAIILYEQSHYRGRSLILYPGEQIDNFDHYEWVFRVRSIEVIGPVSTVLFDETGLWGHQLDVYRDIPDLSDYRMRLNNYSSFCWHNRARSAFVSYRDPEVSISIQIGPGRILPRIFCGRPITPHYYWIPQPKRYHHPRPKWYHERPKAVPHPPHSRTYRQPPGLPPRVTPKGRPPNAPPRTTPPGAPRNRPQSVPPKRGKSPSARPPSRNETPTTRQPSRTAPTKSPSARPQTRESKSPPATRPASRAPSSAPAARAPKQSRQPAARSNPRSAPSSPPPQRSSNNRSAPPPR
tara:strand:- start:20739 stop:21758 length:1020 start_codon:yes stop_codon:yes gene_type:complete